MSGASHSTVRAWAELLRAPLLLTPLADVLAGATVCIAALAAAGHGPALDASTLNPVAVPSLVARLLVASACGVLLLAGGMALNGVVDLPEDRRSKPGRPLPRGAVSARGATLLTAACLVAAPLAALSIDRRSAAVAVALALVVLAYHFGLKRLRLPGCVALGLARGLDVLLGAVAVQALLLPPGTPHAVPSLTLLAPDALLPVASFALLYGLYITGAALHASTDDESGGSPWSPVGLTLAAAVLVVLPFPWGPGSASAAARFTGPAAFVAALTLLRLVAAWRRLPAPALTGVALSGLHGVHASACLAAGAGRFGLLAAGVILLLFALSRVWLRSLPPS